MINLYKENVKNIKKIINKLNSKKNSKNNIEILKFELDIELNKLEGKLLANYIKNVNDFKYNDLNEVNLLKLDFILMKFIMINSGKYFLKNLISELEEVINYSGEVCREDIRCEQT